MAHLETPLVDVNLLFHNAEATLDAAIASVVTQCWPNWRLTLLDDGSTDEGPGIARAWAGRDSRIRLKRHRANQGIVGAYRRAFTHGDADFVMPKSADDLIAPDFISAIMRVLLAEPGAAMCHSGAVNIDAEGRVTAEVPAGTRLHTPGGGALPRAAYVMRSYAFSPSFWGIYRRSALDMASPPMACGGWDHAFLAEIALYGDIRHVPRPLFLRRGEPAPLWQLARNAGLAWVRNRSQGDIFTDFSALAPLASSAWAHVETFALARISAIERASLIEAARDILRDRWQDRLRQEAILLAGRLPVLMDLAQRAAEGGATGAATRMRLDLQRVVEGLAWVLDGAAEARTLSAQCSALGLAPHARLAAA